MGRRRDGFIIVAVLWLLGALATLAAIYAAYVGTIAAGLTVNSDRVQAEGLVTAAVELAAWRLSAVDEERRPTRGDFTFRLGGASVAVAHVAEAARIDLNAGSKELIAGLFAALGARRPEADDHAERVLGWRSRPETEIEEQDKEISAYRAAGLPYKPRQGPFADAGELWLVLGLPPALVESALPHVTVYSGQAEIDVLNAAPPVIAALPGMTPDRLHDVLRQRAAAPQDVRTLFAFLGPAQGAATTRLGRSVRLQVAISFATGRRVGAEVVIQLSDEADMPYRVLAWRSDFDGD
jgi:general secretion pathway protein K